MKTVDAKFISSLSYPDFVGYINQWNVLPGAYTTLSKWAVFSRMDASSRILQVACTTGFQSREISLLTGCSGKAFDLSEQAVEMAKYNLEHYAPQARIEYFVADGHKLETDEKFSHVLVGAGLKFFKDPAVALQKSISFLQDGGYLLASPFYVNSEVPEAVIKKCQKVFGITPTAEPYKEIMSLYQGLEIIYEDRNKIPLETEHELKHYCQSTIERACKIRSINDQAVYDAMYERLLEIKEMTNALRHYQEFSVLVARYRASVYPNRYVELF